MKLIKLSSREIDFINDITEYFFNSNLTKGYTITRKGYKFDKDEMLELQEKLK